MFLIFNRFAVVSLALTNQVDKQQLGSQTSQQLTHISENYNVTDVGNISRLFL
ncbi:hypothetical protein M758_5G009100 [Ceratodon purpureus]|nr:hypothetical protein M758_5G009100 [Ceratodon purpureus]